MTRAVALLNAAMTVQRAKTIAVRDAATTIAIARNGGATAIGTWAAITDIPPPPCCAWSRVEALIARLVFADIVREMAPRRLLAEGNEMKRAA